MSKRGSFVLFLIFAYPHITVHLSCFISFTGGDTGVAISKKAGMVPLQMELGGKDACIVLEDADLDLAAGNIVKGGYSYRYVNFIFLMLLLNTINHWRYEDDRRSLFVVEFI